MSIQSTFFWTIKIGSTFNLQDELFTKLNKNSAISTKDHRQIKIAEETKVEIPKNWAAI